jgi:hypothetical protein
LLVDRAAVHHIRRRGHARENGVSIAEWRGALRYGQTQLTPGCEKNDDYDKE